MRSGFQQFWERFPRKTAKLAALKAWEKAVRIDSVDNIIAGVERYKAAKPDYADWCHPATFLNQGRWMDEEDEPVFQPVKAHWYEECQQLHGGKCSKQWDHEMRKRESA